MTNSIWSYHLRTPTIWFPTGTIAALGYEVGHAAVVNETTIRDMHPLVSLDCFGVHDVFVSLATFQAEGAIDQVSEYSG